MSLAHVLHDYRPCLVAAFMQADLRVGSHRLIERYKSLKGLAQDRDSLRRRLDEELIAKVYLLLYNGYRIRACVTKREDPR